MLMYVGLVNPYTTKNKTFFEQFNEFFIAIIIYHLMCFADTMPDIGAQNTIGWSMIVAVLFNLLFNIFYIMFLAIKDMKIKLLTKFYNWKITKLKKSIEIKKARQMAQAVEQSMLKFHHGGHQESFGEFEKPDLTENTPIVPGLRKNLPIETILKRRQPSK
jgi:hypothetical protein